MKRSIALALLASCAGGAAVAPVAPAIDAAAPIVDARADVADAAVDAPPDAPAVAPRPRAVVIPYGDDEALLTRSETARLAAIARARFAEQTIAPVDVVGADEQAALEALAASGRMREGGPVCAEPASLQRVVNARWPSTRAILLDVQCRSAQDCVVRAELRKSQAEGPVRWGWIYDWEELARIAAPVGAADDVSAFERALRDSALLPFKWEEHKRWLRQPSGKELVSKVLGAWVLLASPSWAARPSGADFAPERAELEACVKGAKGRFVGELVLGVEPSGSVAACETELPSCVCAALRKHTFVAGTGTRRMRLALARGVRRSSSDSPRQDERPRVDISPPPELEIETRDAVADFLVEKKLAACFTASPKPTSREVTVLVDLDDAGRVTGVVFEKNDKGDAVFTTKESACVQRTLTAIPLPCPLDEASRRFRLTITVET